MRRYIPERGDLVWLAFQPQAGHEQAGRRPAVTLTPKAYNQRTGLAIFCPITSQIKGYPFEVALPDGLPINGVILADQARSLDWAVREAEYMGTVSNECLEHVRGKLRALI